MKLETSTFAADRSLPLPSGTESVRDWSTYLRSLADNHSCNTHPLFARLDACDPTPSRIAAFLRNYDAHAGVLRRLLLKTATIMPEEACGYVLENVRNEYGNGNPDERHELQLSDLARRAGIGCDEFKKEPVRERVRSFIRQVVPLYYPLKLDCPKAYRRAAIAAGAVTATELLAVKEFVHIQHMFEKIGLGNHIWFDHIDVEVEHSDESLALALHFISRYGASEDVIFGLAGVLDANISLYDGLLETLA